MTTRLCESRVSRDNPAPCIAEANGADGLCAAHRAQRRLERERGAIELAAKAWRLVGEAQARVVLENRGYAWATFLPRLEAAKARQEARSRTATRARKAATP